ncbi:D-alanyl-D-alanine carboxypeptidase/D-alanyl-D-alanine-endopeptidase [Tomitella gaofuii]|uniref:D-alanyl-D-alanine carboxypeptidase/D-alanyl-D-alanine endopeptidase n=1 Tax=Tomitella gaofuii TaxID=2760083 RepID=UPI0015F96854|nr:D-alanyl-D-alanine carboxypeptidase/D-alanyl-D-alanine-endopeptidase [Tomitella gaofuii]
MLKRVLPGNGAAAGHLHRRRRRLRIAAVVLATLLVVVAGVLAWRVIDDGSAVAAAQPAPALITPSPQIVPVPPDAPVPTAAGLDAALAGVLADPALGDLTGQISDAATGRVLWSQDAQRPRTPASVTKLLTSAAALLAIPRDQRITTTVVQSADGRVVLVGGGDPTLTAQPVGAEGYYRGAAHIAQLAEQIRASGAEVTGVDVDVDLYQGPTLAQGWFDSDIAAGNIIPMRPIALDGGRLDIRNPDSPRSDTPALDAGRALAAALGVDAGGVRLAPAPPQAQQLASVQSAPMVELIRQLLVHSDNVLADAVGRQVALATGHPADFDGAAAAIESVLRGAGFDLTGVELHDSSGMSVDNKIPARLLDQLLSAAAGPGHPALRPLLDSLPVAAGTGTLADRYETTAQAGAGWVRAKTGTLSGVSTLAGVVTDVDGRVLAFALMSGGTAPADARPALDAITAQLRGCGCQG